MSNAHIKIKINKTNAIYTKFEVITNSPKALEEWFCSLHDCITCPFFMKEESACQLYGFLRQVEAVSL